jgi:hypothetical protein
MLMRAHPRWWPWLKRRSAACSCWSSVPAGALRPHGGLGAVKQSMLELPRPVLLQGLAVRCREPLVYSLLDLVGRHYTGHHLRAAKVMQVSFISYAFNLNLGSLVGGIGFRYRLYGKLGVRYGDITRIVTLSMITNWLGYILLAGLVFTIAPLQLPPKWKIDSEELRWWACAARVHGGVPGPVRLRRSAAAGTSAATRSTCRRCAWRCAAGHLLHALDDDGGRALGAAARAGGLPDGSRCC